MKTEVIAGNNGGRARPQPRKSPAPAMPAAIDDLSRLRAAKAEVQMIRLGAQRELEMSKQIRAEAEKFRRQIEIKARSQAQLLLLQARLATQKEIAELKRKIGEEMQKMLADIRMIRFTAQEELEIQRKFTNAARIEAMSLSIQRDDTPKGADRQEAIVS